RLHEGGLARLLEPLIGYARGRRSAVAFTDLSPDSGMVGAVLTNQPAADAARVAGFDVAARGPVFVATFGPGLDAEDLAAALAALRLAAVLALAGQPDSPQAYAGYTISLGAARRVTGRVTFDARKAASGGWIYVGDRGGVEDAAAVRMARAVVLMSGGLFS